MHRSLALAGLLLLPSVALGGPPRTYPDVGSAIEATDGDKAILVEFLESGTPETDDVKQRLLATREFQAWAEEEVVVVVFDMPPAARPDENALARTIMGEFSVRATPTFVLLNADAYELGRLGGVETGVQAWLAEANSVLEAPPGRLRGPYRDPSRGSGATRALLALAFVVAFVVAVVVKRANGIDTAPKGRGVLVDMGPPRAAPAPAVKPITDDPTFGDARARELKASLRAGKWQAVEEHLRSTSDPEQREFLVEALADWPLSKAFASRPELLPAWIAAAPTSALPHLLQGRWLIQQAWEARGGGVASRVTGEGLALFRAHLQAADKAFVRAAELDAQDALPWAFRVTVDRGLSRGLALAREHFEEAIRRHAESRAAHTALLTALCKKWQGSHEEMFTFARDAAARARPGSWLPALVAMAHAERWLYVGMASAEDDEPFRGKADGYWKQPDVRTELVEAHDRSLHHPSFVEASPRAAVERNWFAFCLWQVSEQDRLRAELERLGARATPLPWQWCGHAGFHLARKQAGLPPLALA